MKIQDLRIGNYVQLHGKQVQVLEIWDNALKTTDTRTNCAYFIEQFKPIPLTEEILLKCGFEKCNFTKNHYNIKGIRIWKCNDMFLCDKNGVHIKYLHQLQNLCYILTNQELNYE